MTYVQFAILGLGAGAIYAAVALGVLLVHRGSGVVNFAYGAMAMSVVYVYAILRSDGNLNVPIVGAPVMHLGAPLGFWPATLIALAYAAVLGFLCHLLMSGPLRNATTLARVIATVGIMTYLQATAALRYGTLSTSVPAAIPQAIIEISGARVPRDRIILTAVVIGIALALAALFKLTRVGLAIRGAAENEHAAAYLGWSPVRLSALTWVGGTVLAGVIAILVAPITSLDPTIFTLFVIPALGAALLARFRSFVVCVAAGLGIGMLQSVVTKLSVDFGFMRNLTGLREGVPFIVIVIALVAVGASLPGRGAMAEKRPPPAPSTVATFKIPAIVSALGLVAIIATSGGWRYALMTSMVTALLCLSLVVLTGFVGQISLAQMTFAGMGGFMLSKFAEGMGIPFPIAPLLAALAAAAVGFVVALPALRVRGVHLAIVTLALAQGVEEFVFKNPHFSGGFSGTHVPAPKLFGLDLSVNAKGGGFRIAFGVMVLIVLTLVAVAVINLRRSDTGRAMLAVRANERAAAAAGISVVGIKITAFTLSAFIAGLAGTLLAYQQSGGNLSFESFGVFASLALLTSAFIGGITTVSGGIIGGVLASGGLLSFAATKWITGYSRYELIVGGLGLIVVAIRQPIGVAGEIIMNLPKNRRARRAEPPRRTSASAAGARPAVLQTPELQGGVK
ncbi:MAG: hypothetical protein JWN46_2853 [Acidimicrobiales bacterium]|nr:hypothetical protein [Acidimicrobiales bacterium]